MSHRAARNFTCLVFAATLASCGGGEPASSPVAAPMAGPSALESVDIAPGAGAAITAGQKAVVQYTGWLYESSAADKKGQQFDSSQNSGMPFSFNLGTGQVIKGWDRGVLGMKVGGRRRLTIPADLAYGDSGAGGVIPPGATLVFDIELVAIE